MATHPNSRRLGRQRDGDGVRLGPAWGRVLYNRRVLCPEADKRRAWHRHLTSTVS